MPHIWSLVVKQVVVVDDEPPLPPVGAHPAATMLV